MNSLKYLMIASVLLSALVCNAQSKNQKTETVKIYANCEMCESTIEKAGNMKNQANVDWDKETKMATISYDSLKTSIEEILKRIALAGYDNDTFLAPDDTYANLPGCCQYERVKKAAAIMEEPKMEMTASLNHSSMNEAIQEENPLSKVFDNYLEVKDNLVKSDGKAASKNAVIMLESIKYVEMDKLSMDVHMVWMKLLNDLKKDVQKISETQNIESQRASFKSLSKNVYEIIKLSKTSETIYYQYCPMQDANWLSKEETIKNPYYGSQMLSCGKTIETIKE